MRRLRAVAGDAPAVLAALRDALAGGDAIIPLPPDAEAADLPATVPQRAALVVQTSGSTASPKRVVLSADALLAGAAASEVALDGPGQWLLALPAHYIAGINVLTRSITSGTEPVILAEGPFDPLAFAAAAAALDHSVRYTSLVPAQLARLLDQDAALEVLRRFDRILVGGQATPTALLAQALELGLNITRTYGSSETAGGCVYDGVPFASASVRIRRGQIEIAGPMLADGYLGDPARTAKAFIQADGLTWYRTGDRGEFSDGVLTVTGRLDDQIVSGGINVALGAVESVVRSIAGLADAVVVAAPSERWGQVPVIVSTASVDLVSVRAQVAAELGPAAAPAALVRLEHLPMLPAGKPDRRAIARSVPPQP